MKNFITDLLLATVVLVVFVATFIYIIPAVGAKFGPSKEEMQSSYRAEAYHQYLVRKGVINE